MINFEGGAIAEEYQVEYVVDRVEATSSAFMGLTMGCARCHSHKYDPITHKEFYQFFAFFNTVPERGLDGRTRQRRAGSAAAVARPADAARRARRGHRGENRRARRRRRRSAAARVGEDAAADWFRRHRLGADGLVAHYELDGNFSDISGRFQHGRMVAGDPTFEAGRIGRAVSFDGDTEVSFGNVGAVRSRRTASAIAFWVRPRGNQPMHVLQKLDDAQRRRGYEWRFDDIAARRDSAMGRAPDGHARVRRAGRRDPDSDPRAAQVRRLASRRADLRRIRQGGGPAPLCERRAGGCRSACATRWRGRSPPTLR